MTQLPQDKNSIMRQRRDAKVHDHLLQYAPVWLVDEKILPDKDAVQFDVVFLHPKYGWLKRRYFYDSYNDVLYHKGQVPIDEEETFDLQAQEPYVRAEVVNTVNSYGG